MDKNSFINVLQHYSASSVEEAQEILSLLQRYPYSQALHALAARVCKDHGFSNQQEVLQLAAVYASDRSVLREIISNDAYYPKDEKPVATQTVVTSEKSKIVTTYSASLSVDFADELALDLKRLHQSRQNFEKMFEELSSGKIDGEGSLNGTTAASTEEDAAVVEKDSAIKSKKARIVELAKALLETSAEIAKTPPVIRRKKESTGDVLIDEIASTKTEINPETEKQKKQIEVIEQFIKAQPTLVNTKEKIIAASAEDLSTIKTGEFGDHIISETLVDILLKQGKKDKAIEVLKKLIWKFPQKKAYFAAQIEELKK